VLRKPTVPAWVVNQLAHHRPELVSAVVAAGEELERAQVRALNGESAPGFHEARALEAEALAELLDAAHAMVPSITASTAERVIRTLRAGASWDEGRRALIEGRLTSELDPRGFEAIAGAPATSASSSALPTSQVSLASDRRLLSKLSKARSAAAALTVDANRAEAAALVAETAAKRLRRVADEARSRADRASRVLADFESEATRAD
jgi:hypothetical protein